MEYNGKKILAKPNGNTYDIIEALIDITPTAIQQVKPKIKTLVPVTGNAYIDAKSIAKFIRKNITYKADGYENQNIQLPARLIYDTKTGDCKSFSLLFASLMNAAGHKAGYRFASYKKNKIPTHVYNWFLDSENNFYIFDTCIKNLKESKRYTYIKDMNVNYLTGSPDKVFINGKAERDARQAARKAKREKNREEGKGVFQGAKKIALSAPRSAFRGLIALNVRGLATRLNKALSKDRKKLEDLWKRLGGTVDKLQESINTGKNKKPLLGAKKGITGLYDYDYLNDNTEPYLGVAIETVIASASAILIPVSKMLKDLGIGTEETGGEDIITSEEEQEAEESGNKIMNSNFVAADDENAPAGSSTGFKPSPLLIGGVLGAGVLLYLLTKKKR
jgi:hypothetical protein